VKLRGCRSRISVYFYGHFILLDFLTFRITSLSCGSPSGLGSVKKPD
jgi:hypothetical protein